ncbi:myosin-J heavy chain-like [Planoprotostelium fungivorum]|uniref:Myosin-J heavy chain-like n=1 Tax=Planoprotostelium fungivorum TaxID=1890364 RepID=A0A2P6MV49_9EUKA|nr:myosin-J heavy chain-like [Planoprotostelium fungivorum]
MCWSAFYNFIDMAVCGCYPDIPRISIQEDHSEKIYNRGKKLVSQHTTRFAYLIEPLLLSRHSPRFRGMIQYLLFVTYRCAAYILSSGSVGDTPEATPLYGEDIIHQYRGLENDLPPHIFAIADASYDALLKINASQSVLILGQSGAGKTETTKYLMKHLVESTTRGETEEGQGRLIPSWAFGNAKTLRNNNSSRFGKFIKAADSFHHLRQSEKVRMIWGTLTKTNQRIFEIY